MKNELDLITSLEGETRAQRQGDFTDLRTVQVNQRIARTTRQELRTKSYWEIIIYWDLIILMSVVNKFMSFNDPLLWQIELRFFFKFRKKYFKKWGLKFTSMDIFI
jgi:hypothetical protein